MERHGEVFVLIGRVVNTFILRLAFVPLQRPFIPIVRLIPVSRRFEAAPLAVELHVAANSCYDVPNMGVREVVLFVHKPVFLLGRRIIHALISQIALAVLPASLAHSPIPSCSNIGATYQSLCPSIFMPNRFLRLSRTLMYFVISLLLIPQKSIPIRFLRCGRSPNGHPCDRLHE